MGIASTCKWRVVCTMTMRHPETLSSYDLEINIIVSLGGLGGSTI